MPQLVARSSEMMSRAREGLQAKEDYLILLKEMVKLMVEE